MAIITGLIVGNVATLPQRLKPGIKFSKRTILRLGIILLGIRLCLSDVFRFGTLALPLVILCIVGAVLFARWLGNRLELSSRMSTLVGVGTSICGATAIVAAGPAIDAKEEEIAYAVANITVFGLLAMLLYPYLAHTLFGSDPTAAGLFIGTSIHETAQVAGSGLIYAQVFDAPEALNVATVTKLIRNVFIAVVIPLTAYLRNRKHGTAKSASFFSLFPTFIIGFVLMAAFRSIGDLTLESGKAWGVMTESDWSALIGLIRTWAENFLAMAMAGVGLGTSIRELRKLGFKPFYVGLGASLIVGVISLGGIAMLKALGLC
jgi:uncharacterized integral membrane protein (TIGR00698 family)